MARATQSEFQRVRWSVFLEETFAGTSASRNRVAEALDLPTSRVSQWMSGERGVEAGTAFALGETLRCDFGIATSGIEALYAAGYFGDVLRVLRAVSLDERPESRRIAVALYAALPGGFLASDVRALERYPRAVDGYRENEFEKHEAARVRRDAAIAGMPATPAFAGARDSCRAIAFSQAAFAVVAGAYGRAQRPLDLPRITLPRSIAQPSIVAPAPAATASAAPDRLRLEAAPPPLEPPPVEAVAAVADVVIALARALEAHNPTLAAPRLWRMLAEWAIELDRETYARCVPALPSAFVAAAALEGAG